MMFISGSIPDNEAGAAAWKAEFKNPSAEEKSFLVPKRKNHSDPVDDPVADWNLYN